MSEDIYRRAGEDIQYPQEEAYQQKMRSFELNFLPPVDRLYIIVMLARIFAVIVLSRNILVL